MSKLRNKELKMRLIGKKASTMQERVYKKEDPVFQIGRSLRAMLVHMVFLDLLLFFCFGALFMR